MNEIILNKMKNFFNSDRTKDVKFRIKELKNLKKAILKYQPKIIKALRDDLKKPEVESISMEIIPVIKEIDYAVRNLKEWSKPEKVQIPWYLKPAKGYILNEPYGTALIISAFNYPFQLAFTPLTGAIAAGNCAVIKPSSSSSASALIIDEIIKETFDENFVRCENNVRAHELIDLKFDYIFFTGSPETGAAVAMKAGEKLIPYTLELGGKSPAIVEKTANLENAARKIVWGKFANAGQTCIAPDYLYVQKEIKERLIDEIKKAIKEFFGPDAQRSENYGRIKDEEAFIRIKNLIDYGKLISGGSVDECGLYIEPTLLECKSFNEPVMKKEIFGPLLPILTFESVEEVILNLKNKEKPLALYFFSNNSKEADKIFTSLSFGGGAYNETLIHTSPLTLPFGGVGSSGFGRYHGKFTYETFSHKKSILINEQKYPRKKNFAPYDKKFLKYTF